MRAAILMAFLITSLQISLSFANPHAGMGSSMPANPEGTTLTGTVSETLNSGGYTYILVDLGKGSKKWVAIPVSDVAVGQKVTVAPGVEMGEFTSPTLKRTFKDVLFSSGLVNAPGKETKKAEAKPKAPASSAPIKIEKASGKNSYTIGEVFEKSGTLANKPVRIRGQVVKVSSGIMGTNWIHLRDGSGSPGSDDLVVTSKELPNVGDVVVASGKLSKDRDFGGGYRYAVIIENAAFGK
jgi:hypothetical protein